MTDLVVFIACAGPNVFKVNLVEAICSIAKNIGDFEYKFYIVVDKPDIETLTKQIFDDERLRKFIKKDSLLEVVYTKDSWATDYNEFFDKYKELTKYILLSHDDLIVHTDNFIGKTLEEIEGKEDEVGWIVYTNNNYYNLPNGPMPNTTKMGFHPDAGNFPFVHECHNFKQGQRLSEENKHLMDFPERAVKVHASMFIPSLISVEAMKKIGPCAYFGPYTMLVDEDWSLEALKNNLNNVWIPSVFITHPNPKNTHNRRFDLRFSEEAHKLFYEKWGFYAHSDYVIPERREEILEKYKDTNIPWSSYKNSYEWDYLKDE